ncbi:MAG: PEP-CTERM sorting domain-containing protein [Pseudomonadota bacterium]
MKGLIAAVALFFSFNSYGLVIYSNDDGTSDQALGCFGPCGIDFWWAQGFSEQAAGNVITSIDIAYGSPLLPGSNPANGTPISLYVYDDPTNDLNPTDAVLLAMFSTTVMNSGTDTFNSIAITPTMITGDFFVAALIRNIDEIGVAPIDQTTDANASWLAGGTNLDPNNLTGTDDIFPLSTTTSNFVPGNWLLRAVGEQGSAPVPIPATLMLFGIGLVALRLARRR